MKQLRFGDGDLCKDTARKQLIQAWQTPKLMLFPLHHTDFYPSSLGLCLQVYISYEVKKGPLLS